MTPFYIAPANRIALTSLSVAVLATGAIVLFHPLSLSALGFGGASAPPSSAPAAYSSSATNTVYLSPQTANSAAVVQPQDVPMAEVNIANSGLTLLRGARVTSVSGGTIQLGISLGAAQLIWSTHTAYGTQIYDSKGTKSTIDAIRIGDIVTVTGQLDESSGQPSVTAQYIRDQSI